MKKWMILGIMFLCMISVWPLCLVRRTREERSGDTGHLLSDGIRQGECISQTFQATESYMESLGFVLTFEEEQMREGNIRFELWSAGGKLLCQQEIGYMWLPNYKYFDMHVDQRLKKNAIYEFRIVNVDVVENLPKVVYTNDTTVDAAPSVEMVLNRERVEGCALGKYTWKEPLDWQSILELWAFLGMAGFILMEIAQGFGKSARI
ncbi:MAG: hypothetical protein J1E64_09205 [Acetatifactor sp.]|nr:hypothetical protein [Acetatifactor sp.]